MIQTLSLPGMVPMLIFMSALHILSLAFAGLLCFSFQRTRKSQRMMIETFLDSLEPSSIPRTCRRHCRIHPARMYVYALSTISIVIVSLLLFVFQPHLL